MATALVAFTACVGVFAGELKTQDFQIGSSNTIEMVGKIEPNILSVTMPAYIPFNISNSVTEENKVISPRISIQNNSNVPVQISVHETKVDLSKVYPVQWSNSIIVSDGAVMVGDHSIAIGFKEEEEVNKMPTSLKDVKWLKVSNSQAINLTKLSGSESKALYVVGTLGSWVSLDGNFSVVPRLVVHY